MSGRVGAGAIAIGVIVVAAHAALVPTLIAATARPALRVAWDGGLVAETPSSGAVDPGVGAVMTREGEAPGLVITRWTTRYRGGHVRSVAAAQLVGPFQDPAAPPCSGRLVVGQRLLDDGAAGPGTVAAIVRTELTAALTGTDEFGIGKFRRVEAVRLRWVGLFEFPFETGMFPAGSLHAPFPTGYLRGEATVVFDRVKIAVVLGVLPRTDGGTLGFSVGVRAHLVVDNFALRWLVDRLGVDRIATRFAEGQLDTALLSALGPPPPLPLPGGRQLVIALCPDRGIEVVSGAYAAVPLRWRLTAPVPVAAPARDASAATPARDASAAASAAREGSTPSLPIRPPRRGPVAWPAPRADTTLAFDLDLDGVNGLLYELWRTGYLDEVLDQLDLAGRFNRHDVVATYLTLRLSPLRLALPPVVAPAAGGRLRLGLVLAVNIADRDAVTPATALGALDVAFVPGDRIRTDVAIAGLDLTCEPVPGTLEPCYGVVVDAIRDNTGDTHAALGDTLSAVLTELFVGRRLADDAAPAVLDLDAARATTTLDGRALRLDLDARVLAP